MTRGREFERQGPSPSPHSLERAGKGPAAPSQSLSPPRQDDGGEIGAREILRMMSSLIDTLNAEVRIAVAAERHRREAEKENTRLKTELEIERDRRRRLEEDVRELGDEYARRHSTDLSGRGNVRGRPSIESRATSEETHPESLPPRHPPDEVTALPPPAHIVEALAEELRRRERAEALEWFRSGMERLVGSNINENRARALDVSGDSRATLPQPEPAEPAAAPPETSPSQPTTTEADAADDGGPLPAGWRFASELPRQRGRRWRLRR
jgi:hypothetical protein